MTIKNIKKKIIAGAVATVLALGLGLTAAAPANACYGNSVTNRSNGAVTIRYDNGNYATLYGWGSKTYNVNWILIDARTKTYVGTTLYYGGYFGYWVRASCGQIWVQEVAWGV